MAKGFMALCTTISILFFGIGCAHAQIQQSFEIMKNSDTQFQNTLDQYCVTCHNETLKTADLLLDKAIVGEVGRDPQLWEKVWLKVKTKSMPPVGMPRPDESFYQSFTIYLEKELDSVAASKPNPGRTVTAHRINRREYTNAIRDLLGLKIDGESLLPADNSGGFDNLGSLLSVSQVLIESYMSAAEIISQLAIGDPAISPDGHTYTISPLFLQHERMNEELPFGTRGGIAVNHHFPLDGEYELKIRLQRTDKSGLVYGIAEPHHVDVRVDGKRIKLIEVGGKHRGLASGLDEHLGDLDQFKYEQFADESLVVRLPVKAGSRLVQVAFLEEEFAWESLFPRPNYDNFVTAYLGDKTDKDILRPWGVPAVSNILIAGPYNSRGPGDTVSWNKIFICTPGNKAEEYPCAQNILSKLGRFGYRRPIDQHDLEPLLSLYQKNRLEGGSFESGIRMAIEGLLASPGFLFRIERDAVNYVENTVYPISNLELASRLSFFLWSSIPDEELLIVAEHGNLRDPATLKQQVIRMLADERSQALISNFSEQWLLLRNLPHVGKNQEMFPDFDENLRRDFNIETQLFLTSVFQDDRSILDLLRADYKFINERLAKHYGIPDVYGNKFRRVAIVDENKKGLLAHGSILTITSYANRTSPVLRGKWVLENILASPPPPPPPNVPDLKVDDDGGNVLSVRGAIEKHRANPVCAVCHNRMDPIGFGLENFNPIGQWRTKDAGQEIDSSGMLPDGSQFEGPAQLQEALLKQADVIASAFTQKLLTYALGRDLEYFDMPTVRKIVGDTAKSDYKFSNIVLGIVNSLPFQMRRTGS